MDTETMARAILAAAEEWRQDANNRLPYGLCKKYGIEVPPGTTPHEAWELLKKHGIDPDGAYGKTAESWERQKAAQRAAKKAAGKTSPQKGKKSPPEAEEKARREAEEKTRREAEERVKREAEEKARKEAEEKAKREAEEKARREAEEKTRREAEERAKREAEGKARREAEEKARREAEERSRREAEERAKREAEEKARREAEGKAGKRKPSGRKNGGKKALPKRIPWTEAKAARNPWQAPAWEGTAGETLKKHYNADDGGAQAYAGVLEELHRDTGTEHWGAEEGIKRAETDEAFSAALENLIKQNAGWRGGPLTGVRMMKQDEINSLLWRGDGSFVPGKAQLWYTDEEDAKDVAGVHGEWEKGEAPVTFHCDSLSRATALPDGEICASKEARYQIKSARYIGGYLHVFLEEKGRTEVSPGWEDLAAQGPRPSMMEPKAFASAEEADEYLDGCGWAYPAGSWGDICGPGRAAIAGTLAALEERYGALAFGGNCARTAAIGDDVLGRDTRAQCESRSANRATTWVRFSARSFGSPEAYARTREEVRKECDDGIKMPCAKGMERYYTAAHEYGHCVQNALLRKMGYTHADSTALQSDTRGEAAIRESIKNGAGKMREDILKIAEGLEPGTDPAGAISLYGLKDPYEFFAECFANSVCGKPNVLGRAMAIYLDGCGFGRDGA